MEQGMTSKSIVDPQGGFARKLVRNEANSSGVSWSAVIAGGFVMAALALILLALGTGLGLASVSPWSNSGMSASAVGTGAIVWLIIMELISSSMGGYLAGRLRTKWTSIHTDEVYFRDTAHGFLAWAVALVITAAFLTSAAASMIGSSATSTDEVGRNTTAQSEDRQFNPNAYFVDSLFRTEDPKLDAAYGPVRTEASVVFINGLRQGRLPTADRDYLSQLVAAATGLSPADAQKRVSDVFATAQKTAENVRRTLAHSLLWTFLALLIGAFCASFAATIGGRQRDHVVVL